MLCQSCQKLALPTNVAGSCRSCTQHTEYFAYKLCADCSETLDQCERCEVPLNLPASQLVLPGSVAFQVMLKDVDNGKTVSGMHIGEEVVVQLEEDQYSQTEWGVKNQSAIGAMLVLVANNGFTPYTGQYQKGTRELVFEVINNGHITLELEEKVRQYSWYRQTAAPSSVTAPNGKQWKVDIKAS
jgi:predicted secreted protein